MTLGERLKAMRHKAGISQEALGAQGFVSTPGWIKVENGQRQASEKLIGDFLRWLVREKYIRSDSSATLQNELLTLRYLGSNSLFVREMARARAQLLPNGESLLVSPVDVSKHRRGRPPKVERSGAHSPSKRQK